MFLRSLCVLVMYTTMVCGADSVDDIVKKAIRETEPEAVKSPEKPSEAVILKVTKKANGDVETIYAIPNGMKIGIKETTETGGPGMPDDRKVVANQMDGIYAVVDGRKYSFKTHTPESANAALAKLSASVVFVNDCDQRVAAPEWYRPPLVKKIGPPPVTQPVTTQPAQRAPQVAQGFPTIRPTPAQSVGHNSMSSQGTMPMAPTTTYAANVGRGGSMVSSSNCST